MAKKTTAKKKVEEAPVPEEVEAPLQVGDHVRFLHDPPNGLPPDHIARVVAVNDEEESPGKVIGVQLPERWPLAHTCDGLLPDLRGWWTRPENVVRVSV